MSKFRKSRGGGGGPMKSKRKSRSKAQRVQAKNAASSKSGGAEQAAAGGKKPNPFDLIFTKRQKNITISKKAAQKPKRKQNSTEIRKQTLEEEFRRRGKANQIVDRRLGQRNVEMSEEARAEKRFLFQQRKLAEKRTTALGSAEDGKGPTNPLLLENPTKRVHWKDLMAADKETKHEDNAGNSSGNEEEEEDDGMDHEDGADGEEASFGHKNAHKNRKEHLADQVRDDRRLRALKSMLRDEQEEQTDRLDRCYRELRKLGMLLPMGGGQPQQETNGEQQEMGTLQPSGRFQPRGERHSVKLKLESKEAKGEQQADEQEDTYDSMYHELQFQSSQTAASILSTQTPAMAAENSTKTTAAAAEANDNPPVEEQQSDEKPMEMKSDFAVAMDEFERILEKTTLLESVDQFGQSLGQLKKLLSERLYPALKKSPFAGSKCMLDRLAQMHEQLEEQPTDEQSAGWPNFSQILFIRLVAMLFPVQRRFHPVSTPTLAFALELISDSRVHSVPQCARLIFLCDQLFPWTGEIGRYLPEVVAFLRGALQLCVPQPAETMAEGTVHQFPTMSFPVSWPHREMLCPTGEKKIAHLPKDKQLPLAAMFFEGKSSADENHAEQPHEEEHFKLLTIRLLLATIHKYSEKYSLSCRPAFNAIFGPFNKLCQRLPTEQYPEELAGEVEGLRQLFAEKLAETATVTQLKICKQKNQRSLKMLEPRIDEHFNPERHGKGGGKDSAKQREQQWAKRARKERRGAIKELRKDARHLAGLYGEQQRKVRRERDAKTKRIMQSLETQESEYKKLRAISGKFK